MVAPIPVANPRDGVVVLDRVTKGGQRLFYRLEVIQQPERARACGSGPKCKQTGPHQRPVNTEVLFL